MNFNFRSHGTKFWLVGVYPAFYSNVLPGNGSDPPDCRAESIMTLTSTTSAILWMPQDRLHNWP